MSTQTTVDSTSAHQSENPARALYKPVAGVLSPLVLSASECFPGISEQDIKSLEGSVGKLFFWGNGFENGKLERVLEESDDLNESITTSLEAIAKVLLYSSFFLLLSY